MIKNEYKVAPLTPKLLNDYLYFFDNITFTENPHWSKCYCFSFHFMGTKEQWNRESNRASAIKFINGQKMKGYLAFHNNIPVGWCNANDRRNYQALLQYYDADIKPEEKVCSIVCFLVHPDYRRKGIAQKILEQICIDYTGQNFDYLEAYPEKGELSCENNYKGPLALYEKLGFEIEKEFDGYFVVRKKVVIY